MQGRLVGQLQPGRLSGQHVLRWDGRDQRGQPLPAGLYLARLRGPGIEQTLKVRKLP